MRRSVAGVAALIMFFGGIGFASACVGPYCPRGSVEFWDTKTDGNWFNYSGESITWTFNLNSDVLTPSGADINPEDVINRAELSIRFTDDCDRNSEYAKLLFDGQIFRTNYEVDAGTAVFGVTSYFNADHTLAVKIEDISGDFGISQLQVHGCYTDIPTNVPEPATLLFLGFGLVGVAGARKFRT